MRARARTEESRPRSRPSHDAPRSDVADGLDPRPRRREERAAAERVNIHTESSSAEKRYIEERTEALTHRHRRATSSVQQGTACGAARAATQVQRDLTTLSAQVRSSSAADEARDCRRVAAFYPPLPHRGEVSACVRTCMCGGVFSLFPQRSPHRYMRMALGYVERTTRARRRNRVLLYRRGLWGNFVLQRERSERGCVDAHRRG